MIQGLPGLDPRSRFQAAALGQRHRSKNTDIVMLITPHVVRTHELTSTDLGSIYIGTQQNVGLGRAAAADCAAWPRRPALRGRRSGHAAASPTSRRTLRREACASRRRRSTRRNAAGAARHVAGARHGQPVATSPAPGLPPPPRDTRRRRRCRRRDADADTHRRRRRPRGAAADGSVTRAESSADGAPPVSRRPRRRPPRRRSSCRHRGRRFRSLVGRTPMPVSINNASRVSVVTLDDYL